jgi:hypothetical protein
MCGRFTPSAGNFAAMRRLFVVVLIGISSFVLAACAPETTGKSSSSTSSTSEPLSPAKASIGATASPSTPLPTPTSRTLVAWTDYSPSLQSEIDAATLAKDCRGIQTFFGMTTATEESMKSTKGHGNSAITAYLDEAMAIANCK